MFLLDTDHYELLVETSKNFNKEKKNSNEELPQTSSLKNLQEELEINEQGIQTSLVDFTFRQRTKREHGVLEGPKNQNNKAQFEIKLSDFKKSIVQTDQGRNQ